MKRELIPAVAQRVTAAWWDDLSPKQKDAYIAKYPNSKYAKQYTSTPAAKRKAAEQKKSGVIPKKATTPSKSAPKSAATKHPLGLNDDDFTDLISDVGDHFGYSPNDHGKVEKELRRHAKTPDGQKALQKVLDATDALVAAKKNTKGKAPPAAYDSLNKAIRSLTKNSKLREQD